MGESLRIDENARARRAVLEHFFAGTEAAATVEELAGVVAQADGGSATRRSVAIRLHHLVLPKLGDTVLGEYDARSRTFRFHGGEFLGEERDRSSDDLWDAVGSELVGHDPATLVDALSDDD